MLNLGWQSKQESTYSYLFNQNGFLQVINLVLIATGLFDLKGTPLLIFIL
jgi:hypothetical protein